MHMFVPLGEVGRGIADAFAAIGKDSSDLVDGGTEAPREEASTGMMKLRFGLAPLLVDYEGVRFDDGLAERLGALCEITQGSLRLLGLDRVAVAAGDLGDDGRERA